MTEWDINLGPLDYKLNTLTLTTLCVFICHHRTTDNGGGHAMQIGWVTFFNNNLIL